MNEKIMCFQCINLKHLDFQYGWCEKKKIIRTNSNKRKCCCYVYNIDIGN